MRPSRTILPKLEERSRLDRYYGTYAGVVEDVSDPLSIFRVRVRVPQIHRGNDVSATDNLPWAHPCFPPGMYRAPDVGDSVWVMFEGGVVENPIWLGVFPAIPDASIIHGRLPNKPSVTVSSVPSPSINDNDPNVRSFVSKTISIPISEVGQGTPSISSPTGFSALGSQLEQAKTQLSQGRSNTSTYVKTPGNESPEETISKKSSDPTVGTITKSIFGHTIVISDDPGNEFIKIIDRIGQEIELVGPVEPILSNNNMRYRSIREASRGDQYQPPTNLKDAFVRIKDAYGQEILLCADQENPYIRIMAKDGSTIRMDYTDHRVIIQARNGSISKPTNVVEGQPVPPSESDPAGNVLEVIEVSTYPKEEGIFLYDNKGNSINLDSVTNQIDIINNVGDTIRMNSETGYVAIKTPDVRLGSFNPGDGTGLVRQSDLQAALDNVVDQMKTIASKFSGVASGRGIPIPSIASILAKASSTVKGI